MDIVLIKEGFPKSLKQGVMTPCSKKFSIFLRSLNVLKGKINKKPASGGQNLLYIILLVFRNQCRFFEQL